MMAMDAPEAFGQLIDRSRKRTTPGPNWPPAPTAWTWSASAAGIRRPISGRPPCSASTCIRILPNWPRLPIARKEFGYVMTTGVERLGSRLADAGVDVLYFVDPVLDRISLEKAGELFGDRMTMVGGLNALGLASGEPRRGSATDMRGPSRSLVRPTVSFCTRWTPSSRTPPGKRVNK